MRLLGYLPKVSVSETPTGTVWWGS
jgi:hypothetical protein